MVDSRTRGESDLVSLDDSRVDSSATGFPKLILSLFFVVCFTTPTVNSLRVGSLESTSRTTHTSRIAPALRDASSFLPLSLCDSSWTLFDLIRLEVRSCLVAIPYLCPTSRFQGGRETGEESRS